MRMNNHVKDVWMGCVGDHVYRVGFGGVLSERLRTDDSIAASEAAANEEQEWLPRFLVLALFAGDIAYEEPSLASRGDI